MRFVLVTVGSRGDVEPFCSLADRLIGQGHDVDIFIQPEYKSLVPTTTTTTTKIGIVNIYELPFTHTDFYKFVGIPNKGSTHTNPRVKFIGTVTDIISSLVFPIWNDILDSVLNDKTTSTSSCCTAIVSSTLARPLCTAISTKTNVPCYVVNLQPISPTTMFPHYSHVDDCVTAVLLKQKEQEQEQEQENKEVENNEAAEEGSSAATATNNSNVQSYIELEKYQHEFLLDSIEDLYITKLQLTKTISFDELQEILYGKNKLIRIVNAFSNVYIPNSSYKDICGNYFYDNIGPLADAYIPSTFQPSNDLIEYLSQFENSNNKNDTTTANNSNEEPTTATEKPICISYGSMPFTQVELVVEVLRELKKPAILIGDAFKTAIAKFEEDNDTNETTNDNNSKKMLFHVSGIPYAWLLPYCSMMLCHGGAGTVQACLRAGIPPVISPLIGDQFFFAKLLHAKGIGIDTQTPLTSITKEILIKSILEAEKILSNTTRLGNIVRGGGDGHQNLGVDNMVQLLVS